MRYASLLFTLTLAGLMVLDWRGTGVSWKPHVGDSFVQWGFGGCIVLLTPPQLPLNPPLMAQSSMTIEIAPPILPLYPYFMRSTGMDFGWWCFHVSHFGCTVPTWFIVLLAATPTAVLWRSWWRKHRFRPGSCQSCGYSLTGLSPLAPCPECGAVRARTSVILDEHKRREQSSS